MTEKNDASTDLTDEAEPSVVPGAEEPVETETPEYDVQADETETPEYDVQADPAAGADPAESESESEAGAVSAENWRPGGDVPAEVAAEHADPAEVDEAVVAADPEAEADAVAADDKDHLEPGELPVEPEVVIDDETMRRALEAILMVTDEPLPVLTLARAVGRPTADVAGALADLSEEYTEQGRGFDLREVAGGWRYYTREESAIYVERFVLDGQQSRLTQAALETLAVVAYKQPVSRARVSAIRGVNVDGVMRTLVTRGLVEEAGADTESQATLYRTSSYFLERMGMQSLDDLPELAPYLPEMDDVEDEMAAQDKAAQDKLDNLDREAAAADAPEPEAAEPNAVADIEASPEVAAAESEAEHSAEAGVPTAEAAETTEPAEAAEPAATEGEIEAGAVGEVGGDRGGVGAGEDAGEAFGTADAGERGSAWSNRTDD